MVPLADIFNHKASVVLLGDAWGVAELADAHGHSDDHQHEQDGEGHEHKHDHSEEDEEEEEEEEVEGEDGSEHEHEHDSEGESEEDAQHGFAVGGMPIIAAAPAAADDAAADGSSAANAGTAIQSYAVLYALAPRVLFLFAVLLAVLTVGILSTPLPTCWQDDMRVMALSLWFVAVVCEPHAHAACPCVTLPLHLLRMLICHTQQQGGCVTASTCG